MPKFQVTEEAIALVDRLVAEGQVTDPRTAKGRLLGKAAKLFKQKGYERTTVRDLASELGIQSGSLFHHFSTKDAILTAVMREVIVYNTARMNQRLSKTKDPTERLKALILSELEAVHGVTGNAMGVLVYEWRSLSEEGQSEILVLREEYERLWFEVLQEGVRAGVVTGEPMIVRRFLQGALSWSTAWYDLKGKLSIEQLADEALKLAVK